MKKGSGSGPFPASVFSVSSVIRFLRGSPSISLLAAWCFMPAGTSKEMGKASTARVAEFAVNLFFAAPAAFAGRFQSS
jgi:hypothetical protein